MLLLSLSNFLAKSRKKFLLRGTQEWRLICEFGPVGIVPSLKIMTDCSLDFLKILFHALSFFHFLHVCQRRS